MNISLLNLNIFVLRQRNETCNILQIHLRLWQNSQLFSNLWWEMHPINKGTTGIACFRCVLCRCCCVLIFFVSVAKIQKDSDTTAYIFKCKNCGSCGGLSMQIRYWYPVFTKTWYISSHVIIHQLIIVYKKRIETGTRNNSKRFNRWTTDE